jgi:hypothetical protein
MEQIKLCVERVTQKELDHEFLRSNLSCKPLQSRFIVIGRDTNRQLSSKLLGESIFQPDRRLIVELAVMSSEAERVKKLILGEFRHPHE